jgi:hypothetical protein
MNLIADLFRSKFFGLPLIFLLLFGAYTKYGVLNVVLYAIGVSFFISLIAHINRRKK